MTAQRDWHSEPEQPETIEIGQPDPVLQEEPAGPGRIAAYTIGGLVILGVVLYGLNRPHPQNEAAQQTAASTRRRNNRCPARTKRPRAAAKAVRPADNRDHRRRAAR